MKIEEAAWLAGIVDGEGCIRIFKSKPENNNRFDRYRLLLVVKMIHKPTIEKIFEITNICPPKKTINNRNSKYRTLWRWNCTDFTAYNILIKLLPFLITKKAEAEEAVRFIEYKKFIKEMSMKNRDECGSFKRCDGTQLKEYEKFRLNLKQFKKCEYKN